MFNVRHLGISAGLVCLFLLSSCILTSPRKVEVEITGLLTDQNGKPLPRQNLDIFFPKELHLEKLEDNEEETRLHAHDVARLATDQNGVFRSMVQYTEGALYFAIPPIGYVPFT